MACQIPPKFGLPSAVRGGLKFGAGAGAAAGDATISPMITARTAMTAMCLLEVRIEILPSSRVPAHRSAVVVPRFQQVRDRYKSDSTFSSGGRDAFACSTGITLKPEHQWRPRGERRRSRYGRPLAAAPVGDAEFAVRGFRNATDRNEAIAAIRRLRINRGSIRDPGNVHPLGGCSGLPERTRGKTKNHGNRTQDGERPVHSDFRE